MSDPFSSYKHADFSAHPVSKPAPPPPVPSRPQSASVSSSQKGAPKSAHPVHPSSPTNRSRSQSHPDPPPVKPPKPYKRVEHPPRILLTGQLFKQTSALLFHTYHPRYVILTPDELWWYASETDFDECREPRRRVRLEKSSYIMDEGHSGNKLSLVTGGKTFVFKGVDHADQANWKEAIERSLNGLKSASAYNLPPPKKGVLSLKVG